MQHHSHKRYVYATINTTQKRLLGQMSGNDDSIIFIGNKTGCGHNFTNSLHYI